MRTLLVLRGIPGSGKSTWIEENKLEEYTLSSDQIRLLYQAPAYKADGNKVICSWEDDKVWNTLTEMLEARLSHGEFVVVDATNTSQKELLRYKKLAHTYRYRMYVVDFSDIQLNVAKERNERREILKRVPEVMIEKMYNRLMKNIEIPSGIILLKPNELKKVYLNPIDLSSYKKIHHIGDVHGCYTALTDYLKDGLKEDEFYIFTGDYIDRGIENAATIKYLMSISNKPNVLLLEGNHEKWLSMWANDKTAYSKEFENNTRLELERDGLSRKEVRKFYRKLAQCAYYQYGGNIYVVTHGGISNICNNLVFVATKQMIEGVGSYEDVTLAEESFVKNLPENYYQIHGHRNNGAAIDFVKRNFNLEGEVEFGNYLRCLQIDEEGFHPIYVKNHVTRDKKVFDSVPELVEAFREDDFIREKKHGNISSFNFTAKAFADKQWNSRTMTARGLFINTLENKICARAYEKFFNRGETLETTDQSLKDNLKFPVKGYVKENGFLGIVGYNSESDDLFITSKSDPSGIFSLWFKQLIEKQMTEENRFKMLNYIKNNDVTFVFECVDQENDAHIIDYEASNIYLLDVINNSIIFSKATYDELILIANELSLQCKELAVEISNWEQLVKWFDEIENPYYKYNGKYIEGFVIEDTIGFMFKEKLYYYNQWKRMRNFKDRVLIGKEFFKEGLNELERDFCDFLIRLMQSNANISTNICELRKLYLKEKEKVNDRQ